ncbi:MAG TPA: bifunctional (p)ppGpp synthetase/guanosine-3',5'-bis(diphosphate) 3'-pyrophosphohydrolase [Chloroflexia bacterium]|nr:bifunctional (p)ppGpp synthetase/guanosine-3',5'-bis(diphosphate) 3'-pyrophosphohydrolase [Chloroflexia bacterium]
MRTVKADLGNNEVTSQVNDPIPYPTPDNSRRPAEDGARPALLVIEGQVAERGYPQVQGPKHALERSEGSKAQSSLDALIKVAQVYTPKSGIEALRKAYNFAAEAHEGQTRGTGDPYITHPTAVTTILAEMHLDLETLQAAILHDVIEDTPVTYDDIKKEFGPTVAHLVEGVTKLGSIPKLRAHADGSIPDKSQREAHQQAENLRKMFLAMFDDPRVVLIKLADRLHNMRTLGGIPIHKQQRIALQTLEIYAPLANRLGMWQIKGELEDLSFSYINPETYDELATMLKETKVARDRYLKRVIGLLEKNLREAGIEASIKGRVKHIYSLWQKMQRKRRPIEHIYDVLAVRIMVDSVKDCYAALGVIHALWPPIPGEFDDYIARPKESMYRSLHTAVWAIENKSLEIQIRTHEMHELAEYGIAAHWRYKEQRGGKRDHSYEQKIAWLRRLMSWRDEVESAQDFVDSLKSDLFQEHIYVFTPEGEIVELPKGATAIDFAYRIHTDLGHQCAGAKVNNRLVPLDTPLESGAVVRIMKDKNRAGPSLDWLQSDRFLKTANARQKVRHFFRRQRRDEKVAQGRTTLDQTLKHLGLVHIAHADVLALFPRFTNLDDFLEAIGNADISPQNISSKLGEHRSDELLLPKSDAPTMTIPTSTAMGVTQLTDTGGVLMTLGRCCKPMPGDEVIGYTTKGRGITIHRSDCSNLQHVQDPGRLMSVSWGSKASRYPAGIRIEALDRSGVLHDLTAMLAADKINIIGLHTHKTPGVAASTLIMTIEVTGVEQLFAIMDRLASVRGVYRVQRDTGGVVE